MATDSIDQDVKFEISASALQWGQDFITTKVDRLVQGQAGQLDSLKRVVQPMYKQFALACSGTGTAVEQHSLSHNSEQCLLQAVPMMIMYYSSDSIWAKYTL